MPSWLKSQHWVVKWLGTITHQVIISTCLNQDLWYHMAWLCVETIITIMLSVTQWFPGSLPLILWKASFISTKIWRSHFPCTTTPGREMLVSHLSSTEWWGFMAFVWGQFHRKWPRHRSLEWRWKLYVWYNTLFPGPQWQSFVSPIHPLCRSFRWITPSRGSFHKRFFLRNSNSMGGNWF